MYNYTTYLIYCQLLHFTEKTSLEKIALFKEAWYNKNNVEFRQIQQKTETYTWAKDCGAALCS